MYRAYFFKYKCQITSLKKKNKIKVKMNDTDKRKKNISIIKIRAIEKI